MDRLLLIHLCLHFVRLCCDGPLDALKLTQSLAAEHDLSTLVVLSIILPGHSGTPHKLTVPGAR